MGRNHPHLCVARRLRELLQEVFQRSSDFRRLFLASPAAKEKGHLAEVSGRPAPDRDTPMQRGRNETGVEKVELNFVAVTPKRATVWSKSMPRRAPTANV